MVRLRAGASVVMLVIAGWGCGGCSARPLEAGPGGAAAHALIDHVTFGPAVMATRVDSAMPAGSSTGPQVNVPFGAPAFEVKPGDTFSIAVPWQGGPITSVNVGFGGSTYYAVQVPPAVGNMQGGVAQIPVSIAPSICDMLSSICHQIQCYEQVDTGNGIVSKAAAMEMVLHCNKGEGCAGGGGGGLDLVFPFPIDLAGIVPPDLL